MLVLFSLTQAATLVTIATVGRWAERPQEEQVSIRLSQSQWAGVNCISTHPSLLLLAENMGHIGASNRVVNCCDYPCGVQGYSQPRIDGESIAKTPRQDGESCAPFED